MLVAVVPAIAVIALVGGMTQGHPKRRLALAGAAAVSVLWIAFLVTVRLSSS